MTDTTNKRRTGAGSSQTSKLSKAKPKTFVKEQAKTRGSATSKDEPQESIVLEAEVIEDPHRDGSEIDSPELVLPELIIDPDGELVSTGFEKAQIEFDDPSADLDESEAQYGLVQSSPLARYLAEIRKYSLLSREEEHELAIQAYENNDVVARNKLVTANLRLVVKIAMDYRRSYVQILDLIQEGNAGLVQAVDRFNPYRNVKLSTYSAWWIRAYILKFLMDNKSLVRMGTTDAQRKLFFRLRSEAERLYALTQRYDTKAIAGSIGVKESDVIEMQERLKSDVSLDAPLDDDGEGRVMDRFSTEELAPDDALEVQELRRLLKQSADEVVKELGQRDAFIFEKRLMSDEPITLQEVGEQFGITRERARQLEARVIEKIKQRLLANSRSQIP